MEGENTDGIQGDGREIQREGGGKYREVRNGGNKEEENTRDGIQGDEGNLEGNPRGEVQRKKEIEGNFSFSPQHRTHHGVFGRKSNALVFRSRKVGPFFSPSLSLSFSFSLSSFNAVI